jgi:2,4-diaminopentanoate dehydrogenase
MGPPGTAGRVVNAIPAVVAAEPGIRTTLDLPFIAGNGSAACGRP